jgi:hypothetical protein
MIKKKNFALIKVHECGSDESYFICCNSSAREADINVREERETKTEKRKEKKEIESNRKDKQVRLYVALDENTRCQCGSTYLSYI